MLFAQRFHDRRQLFFVHVLQRGDDFLSSGNFRMLWFQRRVFIRDLHRHRVHPRQRVDDFRQRHVRG